MEACLVESMETVSSAVAQGGGYPVADRGPGPVLPGWLLVFGVFFTIAWILHIWLELIGLGRLKRRRRQRDYIDPESHQPFVSVYTNRVVRWRAPSPVDPREIEPLEQRVHPRRRGRLREPGRGGQSSSDPGLIRSVRLEAADRAA